MTRSESISAGIKFRVTAFILAIAVMIALIAWAAQSSWRRGGELGDRLTKVQIENLAQGSGAIPKKGEIVSVHVIPRPHNEVDAVLPKKK